MGDLQRRVEVLEQKTNDAATITTPLAYAVSDVFREGETPERLRRVETERARAVELLGDRYPNGIGPGLAIYFDWAALILEVKQ